MRKVLSAALIIVSLSATAVSGSGISALNIPAGTDGNTIAVFFSGDGGWLEIDQVIAENLAAKGIHVIGVDSRRYFRSLRTPAETAEDVSILVKSCKSRLKRERVILIGYSFGADIVPFIVNRFSDSMLSMLDGAIMLGIAGDTTFIVCKDELSGKMKGEFKTMPEINRVKNTPMLFIGGSEDKTTITRNIDSTKYNVVLTKGGHHFGGGLQVPGEYNSQLV